MRKRFAIGSSSGPDVSNLQLRFWMLAVCEFERIRENWRKYAVESDSDYDAVPDYTEDDFTEDAAVAIVLAGTSVSMLVGQNVGSVEKQGKERTPDLRAGISKLFDEVPPHWSNFIKLYADLRHFGEAKHEVVYDVTEDTLCSCMTAAQEIWMKILRTHNMDCSRFQNRFVFE